jgi:hypothetical protein
LTGKSPPGLSQIKNCDRLTFDLGQVLGLISKENIKTVEIILLFFTE